MGDMISTSDTRRRQNLKNVWLEGLDRLTLSQLFNMIEHEIMCYANLTSQSNQISPFLPYVKLQNTQLNSN